MSQERAHAAISQTHAAGHGLIGRLAVAALACTASALACSGGQGSSHGPAAEELWDQVQHARTLRVAMVLQFPPQFYRDARTREPAGFDVEMLKLMAKDLGVQLQIEDMDFTATVPSLLAGKVDIIAAGLVNTPERAKSIQFTDPYVPYQLVAMIQKDAGITDASQLNRSGRIVSVLLGSTSHELAKILFPQAEVRPLERQDACMLEVSSKKADACIMERYLAIPYVRNNPQTTTILSQDKPFSVQYGCLALRYGNPRFLYWVNNWLHYYKASGVLDALYDRIIGPTLKIG
jgi:polar amino acid transport system substrate-binding protein